MAVLLGVGDLATPGHAPTAAIAGYVSLAPQLASPGVRVHVAAGGFQPAELVDVRVTDPIGTELTLGRVQADGQGRLGVDLSPTDYATNGDNLVSVVGPKSGVVASTPVTLIG
jgi:hypothetical protein